MKEFTDSLYTEESFRKRPRDHVVQQSIGATITNEFSAYLNCSDVSQYIGQNGAVSSKFFVFPELSLDFEEKMGSKRLRADHYFRDYCKNHHHVIVSGSEQVGKTELAKEVYRTLYDTHTFLPVLLRLTERYSGKIQNKISAAIQKQYGQSSADFDDVKKIVVIDDFHLAQSRYQRKIIDELMSTPNTWFVAFVDSVFNVNFLERELDEDFELLSIEEFSPTLRNELIQRWMEANEIVDKNYSQLDSYTDFVNSTLLKGLVPATPLNIIVILAEKKAFNPLKSAVTSKGHCYQTLIYLALKKAAITESEIDIYLNVLEHLSYHLFHKGQRSIADSDYTSFLNAYRTEYNLPTANEAVMSKLNESRILCESSLGDYAFSSKYMYYFFVARYISDHKADPDVRSRLNDIYSNLQRSENGYIGVFVVHHLKDEDILEEIQLNLMVLYDEYHEATLDISEIDFLLKHTSKLRQLSMSAFNRSSAERRDALQRLDRTERDDTVAADEAKTDFDVDAEFTALRKALKTAEVMGHILKTRTGSFKLRNQKAYYEEALKLYMRITKRFLDDFQNHESEFLEFFRDRIRCFVAPQRDREQIYRLANRFFLDFNVMNFLACIHRSTFTLASEQILDVIDSVCDTLGTPLSILVKLHARMWHSKTVPIGEFKKLYAEGDRFVNQLIQQMIIRYCDMHDIAVRDKQHIATTFDISLQRMLSPRKSSPRSG